MLQRSVERPTLWAVFEYRDATICESHSVYVSVASLMGARLMGARPNWVR